ncbi:N-formylglutamate amidohydrolase [Pseudonocardia humida]|uniref:N-formylglutamate amidohydrolase n=1 Tax=Pseudonocardia humida TaxID=2800819 RepID=A0ABT1A0V7_9PSEU|nr:N-formylglutamate amidohydrolase [Pseudonocardia humida]MCO1656636.1 N-formylglutamate amidohydrolase [Pseudonocardia humida]
MLLHVPHAGVGVPGWARRHLLPDDEALAAEQAALTDHLTDRIALRASAVAAVAPWVVVNRVSRFVVDPERFPDEREEMAAVGMAAVYTHGTRGQRIRADDADHRAALLAAYYTTWADTVARLVDARLAATGRAVLIDLHSYPSAPLPYELHADGPRPPVCLGTDPAHTPPELTAAARRAFAQVGGAATDSPFGGTYVPARHHGTDRRVRSIMVELRRDGHMVEPAGPVTGGFAVAAAALAALVDAVTS